MKILYGTGNKEKVEAMKKIIKSHGFNAELFTIKDIGFNQEIIEDGKTFEENSAIKANVIRKYCLENNITDKIIITDDAGLCIDKLNGEPGIYTARYAGENATQEQCINKVLDKMKQYTNLDDRTCEFVCVLTAILPNGEKIVERGECIGKVALKAGKLGGLTFGPIFIPQGFDKPMGDMEDEEYASVHNHRDLAMEKIVKKLVEIGYK